MKPIEQLFGLGIQIELQSPNRVAAVGEKRDLLVHPPPIKNNDHILSTDTNGIKHLINRVKQGELDQGDALLIEKLLNILLTIVSLLERKHTSIQRMKELLFGMKEKKQGKDEDKNRAEDGRPGADKIGRASCRERREVEVGG